MANPDDPTFKKLLEHLNQLPDELVDNFSLALAKKIIIDEMTCAITHLKQVLDFPGVSKENREDCAEMIACAMIRLKESIFKTDWTFEEREGHIKQMKDLMLIDKSTL